MYTTRSQDRAELGFLLLTDGATAIHGGSRLLVMDTRPGRRRRTAGQTGGVYLHTVLTSSYVPRAHP